MELHLEVQVERISYLLQRIMDYMLNNNLNIDKATFFTVIIGQITIYGILLTFYQFVASYQGGEKAATRYLGINITEYFVKRNISVFNNIVSRKIFGAIFVLEILYKPFITIYGDMLPIEMIRVMNFTWFFFVIFYFVVFVFLFFQCTKSILMIKLSSDVKTNGYLIRDINNMFLKKTLKERSDKNAIELLAQDLTYLHEAIRLDDNPKLQGRYNQLIYSIFSEYMKRKKYEISVIEKKGKILKNQVPWIYNANYEAHLIMEILEEKYFQLDDDNIRLVSNFHIDLLELNYKRAVLEGYNKVSCNRYECVSMKAEENVFDAAEWKNVTLEIYQKMSNKQKQNIIRILGSGKNRKQDFYEYYCNDCISTLIVREIDSIFAGERKQKDFLEIFGQIMKEERINDFCAQIIRDKIICYNKFDAGEILFQLSEKNCTYLFVYMVMYYSIYRFRFEWEYINVNVLQTLWKRHSDMQDDAGDIIKKIRNSNIGHRFEDEMYIKFMDYVNARVEGELFDRIYADKVLDVFYIWVIKNCVINPNEFMYSIYQDKFDMGTQIIIINELSKHGELMECNSIFKWVQCMRYNIFAQQNSFPEKLNITLRGLLLTNINAVVVANYTYLSCYINVIGTYLLIKLHELSDKTQKQKRIKEIVKKAFTASNMNIDEYINMIEKECRICRCEINYVQKEKIKEYLMRTF